VADDRTLRLPPVESVLAAESSAIRGDVQVEPASLASRTSPRTLNEAGGSHRPVDLGSVLSHDWGRDPDDDVIDLVQLIRSAPEVHATRSDCPVSGKIHRGRRTLCACRKGKRRKLERHNERKNDRSKSHDVFFLLELCADEER
jgi:hypothetical protein